MEIQITPRLEPADLNSTGYFRGGMLFVHLISFSIYYILEMGNFQLATVGISGDFLKIRKIKPV